MNCYEIYEEIYDLLMENVMQVLCVYVMQLFEQYLSNKPSRLMAFEKKLGCCVKCNQKNNILWSLSGDIGKSMYISPQLISNDHKITNVWSQVFVVSWPHIKCL